MFGRLASLMVLRVLSVGMLRAKEARELRVRRLKNVQWRVKKP
jgi:hypothetical protein